MSIRKLAGGFVLSTAVALGAASAWAATLPAGYTEVECITVTNQEQYIDTGFPPYYMTDIEAHFEVPDFSHDNIIYWTRATGFSSFAFITKADSTERTKKVRAYRVSNGQGGVEITLPEYLTERDIWYSTKFVNNQTDNKFTVNDQTVSFVQAGGTGRLPNIFLFRLNDVGSLYTSVKAVVGIKLYTFKIIEGGVAVADLVPCMRNSDSVVGLYDTVRNSFYTNAGSGGSFGYDPKGGRLDVTGFPENLGRPTPAYHGLYRLTAGETVAVSCGATPAADSSGRRMDCFGWKLYDEDGVLLDSGSGTSFTYTHPTPAENRRLEWQWAHPLVILPIPDQANETFNPCRPEFVASNLLDGSTWTLGGDIVSADFDVEYNGNYYPGVATVTVTGKGMYDWADVSASFNVVVTKREDENVSTGDISVRRSIVDGNYVYVFTNAAAAQVVTAKRDIYLADALLVGGGGAGGGKGGGGGGAGGVANATNLVGVLIKKNGIAMVTVGAGGVHSGNPQHKGGNGGETSIELGSFAASVAGGGGGGSWNNATAVAGGSGGGAAQNGTGGAGTAGIGFDGATGLGMNTAKTGGGGGAGHAGYQADTTAMHAGYGGEGVSNNITGAWVVYGGGGGGGGGKGVSDSTTVTPGLGGLGGGGDGGDGSTYNGKAGVDGLGGGGGGGNMSGNGNNGGKGGTGGVGAVILSIKPVVFDIEPIGDQYLDVGASECTPEPVVRTIDGLTLLTKDVDYTVSYTNNTQPGNALLTITGINDYAGKMGYVKFMIYNRYFVKPSVAVEGDGSSWADAMSVTNFFATCGVISNRCEVWIATGTVPGVALTVTNTAPLLVIRGGFAGTETTLAERPAGTLTVLDGTHTVDCLLQIVSTDAAAVLELDRLHFCNARANGVIKTGAGSLRVVDCLIAANGLDSDVYGRGMNVQGGGELSLVVSNCTFAGNVRSGNCGGFGLYLNSMGSALVDDSIFVTNGVPSLTAPKASGNCGSNARGSAIYSDGVPVTVRGCRFAGNRGPIRYSTARSDWGGGVVMLNGACGGSLIDHCVFIGNTDRLSGDGYDEVSTAGALVINLANTTDKVKVNNCTFAYNLTQATGNSAGGITAVKGDVEVVNTILWKNRYSYTKWVGYGSDIQIKKDAKMTIRNSIVTTLDGTGIVSATPANLTIDADTVVAADPKLVTTTADYEALVDTSGTRHYYKTTSADDMVAMDAHLLSPAGYVVNGGATGPATAEYSRAIDFGDSAADYSREPVPNGYRLNAGAYGNTAEASLTTEGQPNAAVDILFPDGMTRPLVQVTMGLESGAAYHGTVHLVCSTGGVVLATKDWDSVAPGDVLAFLLPYYLPNGTELRAVATVVAPGATTISPSATEEANGSYPPYYGKGGGPNVIHVRTGADCLQNGTSWTDAYPDLATAFASAPDASKTEIWLAVTNNYMPTAIALVGSFAVRGGFAGVENSPDERVEGATASLNGKKSYRTLEFSVPAGATLTVERIRFANSSQSELKKSGSGNLVVRDCLFTDSRQDIDTLSGRGIYASDGTVAVTNCLFANLIGPYVLKDATYGGDGIYLNSCTAAYIDHCLFVTNGLVEFSRTKYKQARHSGAAVYVKATPTIFSNCRFAACCAAPHNASDNGGIVFFNGASGGSKLINCTFVGNSDVQGSASNVDILSAGAILCSMSSQDQTLDIENCTVAFNVTEGQKTAAGINVNSGTVSVKNSIVYGNVRGLTSIAQIAGADIEVKSGATLDLRYSLVTGLATNYVGGAGTINVGPGVITVDPLLATTTNYFQSLLASYTSSPVHLYLPQAERGTCAALDVHPRTRTGYLNKDGVLIRDPERVESPTIDKGDPTSDYMGEPMVPGVGYHGRRVNLGAYGNTSEAALTQIPGFYIILR